MTSFAESIFLFIAAIPFIYYLIALYSSMRFFWVSGRYKRQTADFTPPVSILKPNRGLDPEAYENFASFCRQDYPDYEILFCVGENDSALPVLEKLKHDFPTLRIRILEGSECDATNDKVAKLGRLVSHADHEVLVISDSDVRVRPDYLRSVVAPLSDPKVGGVTCLYVSIHADTLTQKLQSIGMISDFYPGILTAWQLDGVQFALGPTIVTTRAKIAGFGGYREIENRPADDLLVGRLIAEQGYRVELLAYVVETVADFQSFSDLIHKRIRWMTVMRHMRRWGHLGLIFTLGLPWSVAAVALHPSLLVAVAYFGSYAILRFALASVIGVWGMKQRGIWKTMLLIPLWDAMAFLIWLISFGRKSIRWRDIDYYISEGKLVPVTPGSSQT
ncbi:MAG TPA: glycosyltransferase [Candidatus Dormibacteraeota bacterium]|nr:glycosyltransferase [Candidatus Dormibacteraeota bacterium]